MKRLSINFLIWGIVLLFVTPIIQAETEEATVDSVLQGVLKIYIDCSSCDHDFLRRDISFVNFVRDRNQADVHILVSRQHTGSGGREYMVEFIGKNDYDNMTDTLIFNTKDADTDDNVRKETAKYFKLGLTRFVAKTNLSEHLSVSFTKPATTSEVKDVWNNWVFEIEANCWMNGDANFRSIDLWNNLSARRVTIDKQIHFGIYWNYNDRKYTDSAGYNLYINRSKGTNGYFVFGINDNWSYAFMYNFFTSTFGNKDFDYSSEAGIEYNIFPYKESSRRSWTIEYDLGVTYMDYTVRTVYNKTNEWLTYTRLKNSVKFTQPWGSVFWSLNGIVYFYDLDKNRLTLSGGMSVKLFEGFSINFDGNYSRVRDQIALSGEGASKVDILLRQRELASGYNYWFSFGASYSFGSIYNNIVNPRF